MNDQLTVSESPLLDRDDALTRLAHCANESHVKVAGAIQQAVLHALEAGRALLEAKRLCRKGTWTGWLKDNFDGSDRTARGYMRLVVYWNQVGGDWQRAASLSQRQIERLLKGISCSDGRANPGRLTSQQRLATEAETDQAPSQPACADSTTSAPATPQLLPAAANGDPFGTVVRFLEQAVNELRRLQDKPEHARYARHLMQLIERTRVGITQRRWFWKMLNR